MAKETEGDFTVEVNVDVSPFEAVQEETWYVIDDYRLAMILAKMHTPEIDEAVERSMDLYKKLNWKQLSLSDRIMLGNALTLGNHYMEGYEVLANAAATAFQQSEGYGKWVEWQAGWAAWMANDKAKYEAAFGRVLSDADGKPVDQTEWSYSEWIAACFLDKVSQAELMKYCSDDVAKLDDPHFFSGEKSLKSREYDKASKAYTVCISEGEKAHDTFPSNWARWRLKQIQKTQKERGGAGSSR